MKNARLKLLAAALSLPVLFGCAAVRAENAEEAASSRAGGLPEQSGPERTGSAGGLSLSVNPETAAVSVVTAQGETWSTNPDHPAEDDAKVQVKLTYHDGHDRTYTMDSYRNSVANKTFSIQPLENGVQVTYQIGEPEDAVKRIPMKISDKRYGAFFSEDSGLSSADASFVKKRYRREGSGIWVWKETDSEFTLQKMLEILDAAGYTEKDLKQDNRENGIGGAGSKALQFTVAVRYTVRDGALIVEVPLSEIKIPEGVYLTGLTLLEFFGAAPNGETGYLFVPDGCGALIPFSKTGSQELYSANIYGADPVGQSAGPAPGLAETVRLPVFGIHKGNSSFLAVIEESSSNAAVEAYQAERSNGYFSVYAAYTVQTRDYATIGGTAEDARIPVYSKNPRGAIRHRYLFQSGASAGYEGMAAAYRDYLMREQGLERIQTGKDLPFVLKTVGAVQRRKRFLWFQYTSLSPATSFAQDQAMLEQLLEAGVSNPVLVLGAWSKGGLDSQRYDRLTPAPALGGKKQWLSLMRFAESNGISAVAQAGFASFPDGLSRYAQSARTLDQSFAKVDTFDLVSGELDLNAAGRFRLAPSLFLEAAEKITRSLGSIRAKGAYLPDLGETLYADYSNSRTSTREKSAGLAAQAAKALSSTGGPVILSGGNAYLLPFADYVLDAPVASSGFRICGQSVPFYQIALHGLVQYGGSAFNYAESAEDAFLYALATGAVAYYEWSYSNSSFFKDTDHPEYYAAYYRDTLADAAQYYRQMNGALGRLQGSFILRCGKASDNLWKTVYEDGTVVYVNTSKAEAVLDGVAIAAKSFEVRKGESR